MQPRSKFFLISAAVLLLPALLLGSCSTAASDAEEDAPGLTPSPVTSTPVSQTQQPGSTAPSPLTITIWLPDDLILRNEDALLALIQQQIAAYTESHPEVTIDLRLKAEAGSANMMDSLQSTSLAAPAALPDIVLMSRADMEVAALKGLLIPYDGVSDLLSANDWIPSIKQLATIQGSTFGMPVVSDALVYFVDKDEQHTQNAFLVSKPLLAYLNDPSAELLMGLYLSAGGVLMDQEGGPVLESAPLAQALKQVDSARKAGAFPAWMMDIANQSDVYRYYQAERGDRMIAWYSNIPTPARNAMAAQAVPGLSENAATLVDGWFWTMTQPQPEKRQATVDLVEVLTEENFLAQLAATSELIPVRLSPSVVEDTNLNLVAEIAAAGQPIPDGLLLVTISPAMQGSLQSLFGGSNQTIDEIARQASEKIQRP